MKPTLKLEILRNVYLKEKVLKLQNGKNSMNAGLMQKCHKLQFFKRPLECGSEIELIPINTNFTAKPVHV